MKKIIILFVAFLFLAGCSSIPNVIHPYSEPVSVQKGTIEIQDRFNPNSHITATEYTFPFVVRNIVVDSTEMKALVRVKKPKDKSTKVPSILIYFDLIDNKILWTKRSYAWSPKFLDSKIILSGGGKTFALYKKTGEMIWERAGGYGYLNYEKNIALTGLLTAIDLNTGKDFWHRDVEGRFGMEDLKLDGESLIASIDGLHLFDLQNGTGWDLEMSTGKKDELGAAAKNIGIVVLSGVTMAMGGGPVTGTFKANEFSGMNSNILVCGNYIFFAAKDNLVSVEKKTGKEIWRAELPEKKTGKSVILENGDHIILANESYCYKNSEFYRYGIPYIAIFDKTTGEQLFSEDLDTKLYIKDVQLAENGYYVITENELLYFGFDGRLNLKLDLSENDQQYGDNQILLTKNYPFAKYFVQDGQSFVSLKDFLVDPTIPAVETEDGVLIFDANLDIQRWLPKKQIFCVNAENNDTKLLRNTKFNVLRKELNSLEFKIKYGSIAHRKKSQKRYDQIKQDNQDLLRGLYIVGHDGNVKGKIEVTEPVISTNDYFYFIAENGLTLVSKTALK